MPRSSLLFVPAFALLLVGCGADDDGGGSGGPTVEIAQPADGDNLSVPFTFIIKSSEELGPTESGNHHVHIYFDDNDESYEVLESPAGEEIEIDSDSPALEGIEPGEHTLQISLRNADHSAAGAEDEITVTVGEAGGTTGSGSGDDPVYDY